MAQQGHWREAFWILGAIGFLYALPYFLFLRATTEPREVERKTSEVPFAIAELVRSRTFLVLCIVFPAFVFGLWLLYGWLPNFLHEKFVLDLGDAAFNATVFLQGATLLGMLSGGVLADWLYHRTNAARMWLLIASLVFCAPCLHALGGSDSLAATRLAAMGFGLSSGFFMANIFPSAFEVVPANTRASTVGVLNFFGALVSGFAPLVGGVWKKSVGIERLLSWTALVYLVGAALLIAAIRIPFQDDYRRVH